MRCGAEAYSLGAANACRTLEFVVWRGCMAENTPFVVYRYAIEGCLQGMQNKRKSRNYTISDEMS